LGFGLATCNRIVEGHKGTIKIETVKGKGTTFTIILSNESKLESTSEKGWMTKSES
jgi:signal transduction histidine kinase